MMNFNSFMQFCSDYQIFPDICPKNLLHKIFNIITDLSEFNEAGSIYKSEKNFDSRRNSKIGGLNRPDSSRQAIEPALDEHLFVEALGIIAIHKNTSMISMAI